jgi:beta-galactosidase
MLGPNGLQADGSDVALVDVEVVDAKGVRCPTVQQRVDFYLSGGGIWRGGYNSGKTKSINNKYLDVECGINRVAIRSTPLAGSITLSARSGTLRPASLTLTSVTVPRQNGASPDLPQFPAPPKLTKPTYTELAADGPRPSLNSQQDNSQPFSRGRFIKTFSYSGPTTTVCAQSDAHDGERIYADRNDVFVNLPEILKGSDWVQTASADKLFSAVDLIELSATEDSAVYVAHDDRLRRPDWLQRNFKPTESSLVIGGKPMKLFERKIRSAESLTLGSNTENRNMKSCNMYLVFVMRQKGGP